jgi:hypothetical protein
MIIIERATRELQKRTEGSGCEEGIVGLSVDPAIKTCQYDNGACMIASYGGRSAEFVTFDPTRARTKISFMFGANLGTSGARAAACAIINVVTGFLCMNRVMHSCSPECHRPCLTLLQERLKGKRVAICGTSRVLGSALANQVVDLTGEPDIILVTGDGLLSGADEVLLDRDDRGVELMFISPSTSGVATLVDRPHWCPYGKG